MFSLNAPSKGHLKKVLILGDSLTEGYGVALKKAYPSLLEKILTQKGHSVKIINAGSSGSTTASAYSRMLWHLKGKPDILLLALGANDGLRGVNLKSTQANLEKTILLAQKNGLKVILAGMKIPINYGPQYRGNFEALFKNLAKKHNITLIPFLLKGVGGHRKLNLPDGIHPNIKGHKKIAETVLPYIEGEL